MTHAFNRHPGGDRGALALAGSYKQPEKDKTQTPIARLEERDR